MHHRYQFAFHGLFPVPNILHVQPPENFAEGSSQALLQIGTALMAVQ